MTVTYSRFRGGPLDRWCLLVPSRASRVYTDGRGAIWTQCYPAMPAPFVYERQVGDDFELVMEVVAA